MQLSVVLLISVKKSLIKVGAKIYEGHPLDLSVKLEVRLKKALYRLIPISNLMVFWDIAI
jgi:hypothetical protein